MTILTGSIQERRDLESTWDYVDPILLAGAIAISTDVFYGSSNSPKFKIGNGVDPWSSLDYHPDSDIGIRIGTTGIISGTLQDVKDAGATNTGIKLSTTTLQYSGNFRIAFSDTEYLQVTNPSAGNVVFNTVGGVNRAVSIDFGGSSHFILDSGARLYLSDGTPATNGSMIWGYDANLIPATAGLGLYSNSGFTCFYDSLATVTTPKLIIGNGVVIGGNQTTSSLKLRATYGVGASGSDIIFQVGNNGAKEAGRILFDGGWTGVQKRPRTLTENAPGATPAIDGDALDSKHFTGLNTAITSMSVSGTRYADQQLLVSFTDNGTARAIALGSDFENGAATIPTSTVISTRLDMFFIWNSVTSKWRCMAAG